MESLPPKLEALIASERDRDFGARTRMVSLAGARAIHAMGEFDVIELEEPEVDGSADLSMWEKVAPVIGSTIAEVNTLSAQIGSSFPPGDLVVEPKQLAVDKVFQLAATELKDEVMSFGQQVRDPAVVGDRWNLITQLQVFRFRFRDRIGKMVWAAASVFGECKRREVEPGYVDALSSTLLVRSMTADLRRLMRARIHKLSEAPATEMLTQAQQMERELNAFGRTAAWRALRAQDKKGLIEFRSKLRALVAGGNPSKLDLLGLLEPFVEFVDAFGNISRREILAQHDQEVLASVGVVLERALNAPDYDQGVEAFKEAVDASQTLYGRSVEFDTFLRSQRKGLPAPDALGEQVEQFLMQIVALSQY